MTPHSISIFTDGSSRGNPGPGGFGAIIVDGKTITEIGGRENHTTNNRMELQAAISALSIIHNSKFIIHIYTDSSYLINGVTKWIHGWQRNGWKTTAKKDVENRDLWEKLAYSSIYRTIDWEYVGGHIGVAGNTRCDEIATAFADGAKPALYRGSLGNYGVKNILDIKSDIKIAEKKDSHRAHQKAKAYSYVSMVGGVIQTHTTWVECEARVKGRQAKYKKVLSADEERELVAEWSKKP